MSYKFEGCTVFIYDMNGIPLANASIRTHDSYENYIEILKCPELNTGMRCELIILTEPVPYAFSGVVRAGAANKSTVIITLYKGKIWENRSEKRYKLAGTAEITAFIDDEKKNDLHEPINVNLINISSGGIRFSSRTNMLSSNERFGMRLKIGSNDKILAARVVDCRDSDTDEGSIEYGCVFLGVAAE